MQLLVAVSHVMKFRTVILTSVYRGHQNVVLEILTNSGKVYNS